MPMDLCKIDDRYVLTADLPGIDPGSVDVDVDSGHQQPIEPTTVDSE
jgi:HSP20 family protein